MIGTPEHLTLRREGNVGPRGGPQCDLLIVIEVEPHEVFERRGDDVLLELGISVPQAALGAEVRDETAVLPMPRTFVRGTMMRV